MPSILKEEWLDAYYATLEIDTSVQDEIDRLIDPIVERFARQRLKTAIITETHPQATTVHCIAIRLTEQGSPPQIISGSAPTLLKDKFTSRLKKSAANAPCEVSFDL